MMDQYMVGIDFRALNIQSESLIGAKETHFSLRYFNNKIFFFSLISFFYLVITFLIRLQMDQITKD